MATGARQKSLLIAIDSQLCKKKDRPLNVLISRRYAQERSLYVVYTFYIPPQILAAWHQRICGIGREAYPWYINPPASHVQDLVVVPMGRQKRRFGHLLCLCFANGVMYLWV